MSGNIYMRYYSKNVSNVRWAFSVLIEALKVRTLTSSPTARGTHHVTPSGNATLELATREVEEAALRLGMARGTGRAALTVLKAVGAVSRVARGRWIVTVAVVRASWPGEALTALAGREDEELSGARREFLRAAMWSGWDDAYEREYVTQVTQAAFKELWGELRGRSKVAVVILEFVDIGGIWRDYQGMATLAKYITSSLALASCITRV